MNVIGKSLVWIPLPGYDRKKVIEEITQGCIASHDCGDHVWVASMNNLGTTLFCYGLQIGEYDHNGRKFNSYYVKRIPESANPDVYDCPAEIMDMCLAQNLEWRKVVYSKRQ